MKKVLLFGAGSAGENFIEKNTMYEILACIDNNLGKKGNYLRNIPIISPSEIINYEYEFIVITSYWETSIKEQLLNELNIPQHKIITPKKGLVKQADYPFEDLETLDFAKRIIIFLHKKAKEQNIPLYSDYGTLLGIIRDNKLIPWDDDIDFAIDLTHYEKIEELILENINKIDTNVKWTINKLIDVNNTPLGLTITFKTLENKKYKEFEISIACKGNIDGKATKLSSLGQWYTPFEYTQTLNYILWENSYIAIPNNVDKYLSFVYGEWKTPKKNLSFSDFPNAQEVSFDDFKKAQISQITIYEG